MKITKKVLAFLIMTALTISLLAGCADKDTPQPSTTTNNDLTHISGMLVFSANASFNIAYDAVGHVVHIAGLNEEGISLEEEYAYLLGMSCSDAVYELAKTARSDFAPAENLIIKQSLGSHLPDDEFLGTIASKAQAAADDESLKVNVILITAEDLDENGYIGLAMAKNILLSNLGIESPQTLDGYLIPDFNNEYLFYLQADTQVGTFAVNAITGLSRALSEEELRELEGEPDPEFGMPIEEMWSDPENSYDDIQP